MHNVTNLFIGLIFSCPYKNELETCAFKEIRKIDIDERIRYFLSIDLEEQRELIEKHLNCPNTKDYNLIKDIE